MLEFVETRQRINGHSIYSVETIKALDVQSYDWVSDFIILRKALW